VARHPWGEHPVGSIVVERGACYLQIMSTDTPAFAPGAAMPTDQMKATLLSSYIAYSGPCTVNDGEGSVTLKVDAAWRQDYVGTEQKRFFRFENGVLLFGPARDVYAEFDRRHPRVHVVDDVFLALTHANGVRSHLFTSATVGIGGPRLTVLGSAGAFVKHGMDPQEDALLAGAAPGGAGWGREAEANWGRLGAGDAIRTVESEPGDYPRFYAGVQHALATGAPPPVTAAEAVAMMDVLEAARVSARERRVVEVQGTASVGAASLGAADQRGRA
jgi:hypothetical protein